MNQARWNGHQQLVENGGCLNVSDCAAVVLSIVLLVQMDIIGSIKMSLLTILQHYVHFGMDIIGFRQVSVISQLSEIMADMI